VKQRVAFGKPLADFQLTQARIADMATAIDAAALLVYRAAWTRDRGAARITREAAMAKLVATEMAQQVIDGAVQLLGARGSSLVNPSSGSIARFARCESTKAPARFRSSSSLARCSRDRRRLPLTSIRSSGIIAAADMQPSVDWSGVPELNYPSRLNAAGPLLDDWIANGHGDRPALRPRGGDWSYRRLFETSNRIANVLVRGPRLVPGAACCCGRPTSHCSSRAGSQCSRPAASR
jgi:hypothetical protein